MYGATAAVAVLTVFAVSAAIEGTGSFAALTPVEVSSRLQHFLLLRAAPLFLVAVLIEQWVSVSDSLRESERRFRTIFEQAAVGVALIRTATGKFVRVNDRYREIVGLTDGELSAAGRRRMLRPTPVRCASTDHSHSDCR